MAKKSTSLEVRGTTVKVLHVGESDYICLTDIAKSKNREHPADLIRNWLRNRNSLEVLGIWEQLHNPEFNPVEFDGIKMNHSSLSIQNSIFAIGAGIRRNLEGLGYGE